MPIRLSPNTAGRSRSGVPTGGGAYGSRLFRLEVIERNLKVSNQALLICVPVPAPVRVIRRVGLDFVLRR